MTVLPTPMIMGIVNVTPDSFSDGGEYYDADLAIAHGLKLVQEGAVILDIGGESTRPGAQHVPVTEELARVIPVIDGLLAKTKVRLSIDTRKPEVAMAAIDAGATIWNDISALTYSPDSLSVAARLSCDIVLMHAQGTPETMQDNPVYGDVVRDILTWLEARVEACMLAGIDRDRLILDPGIGFGKTLPHNLALTKNLDQFSSLGLPILFGASRKRFISMVDRDGEAKDRVGGSIAAALAAVDRGASIVRVHDVAATRQAMAIWRAINRVNKE